MTPQRSYRYYEFVMAAFVTILICSNLIGPAKIAQLDLPAIVKMGTHPLVPFLAQMQIQRLRAPR